MDIVSGALLAATSLTAWGAFWRYFYGSARMPDEIHYATTSDGWRIALSRYRPGTPGARRHPVLLSHGLGANRLAFDMAEEVSLARSLAASGFDVWALELRGHGLSERPSVQSGRRYGWGFSDYVRLDVPAAAAKVLELSGAAAFHWIGHSMGGAVVYSALGGPDAPRARSAITLGTSLDYSDSDSEFHLIIRARRLLEWLPAIPLGVITLLLSPLGGRIPNPLERFNLWVPNVDPRVARLVLANAWHTISMPVLTELATALEPGGLRSTDRAASYLENLAKVTAPVLAIAGDEDRQCPPDAARGTLDRLGSSDRKLVVMGPESGCRDHYGHFDLLVGKRAAEEVHPVILSWLDGHD